MRNIDKYLNNTTQTSEGVVYKNEDAFNNRKGICYIGEFALEVLQNAESDLSSDLSDAELIDKGIASTYDTIKEEVLARWDEFDDEVKSMSVDEVVSNVFYSTKWEYISTTIDQMTY